MPKSATYLKLHRSIISALFSTIEFSVETDGIFANPFDPAQVDLQIVLAGPEGRQMHLPAFWYQDFDPASAQPRGTPGWRARFTPTLVGNWTAHAVLSSHQGQVTSAEVDIQIGQDPSQTSPGFVRLNPRNPRYFAFDDGSTYYPIGINMGWGSAGQLADYTRWLDRFSANGGNLVRVWMASWSFALEWKDTGLGDYSKRLYRAWLLDQVFQLAEQRGIYVELVLLNHGAFSADVNPEWADNPYNTANGGPCQQPEDFAVNPSARALFERRLRYIAARWAYSPALMAWEWWNEADWTPIHPDQLGAWIQAMTPVLKSYDPYNHLISTSQAKSSLPAINNLPEIDFAQLHLYDGSDPAYNFPDLYKQWSQDIPNKPILFAEFGADAGGENKDSADKLGVHLHNGLWAAAFSGFASTAMYWWWDNYVDPLNLWPEFGGLRNFLQDEDLAALKPGSVRLSSLLLPARSIASPNRLLVWIHDPSNSLGGIQKALEQLFIQAQKAGPDWIFQPSAQEGLTLTVRDLQDGPYQAYWFSPSEGHYLQKQSVTVSAGTALLPVPTFNGDIALKLLPASAPDPTQP